jgi:hypothetical protein
MEAPRRPLDSWNRILAGIRASQVDAAAEESTDLLSHNPRNAYPGALMHHGASTDDLDFLREFEACRTAPDAFNHAAHVKLAYLYLCANPPEIAAQAMKASLQTCIAHCGIDASKFHETITKAWVLAVHHFMTKASTDCPSASAFMAAHPELLDSRIMLTHSAETLFSPDARRAFAQPDIQAIPPS